MKKLVIVVVLVVFCVAAIGLKNTPVIEAGYGDVGHPVPVVPVQNN